MNEYDFTACFVFEMHFINNASHFIYIFYILESDLEFIWSLGDYYLKIVTDILYN